MKNLVRFPALSLEWWRVTIWKCKWNAGNYAHYNLYRQDQEPKLFVRASSVCRPDPTRNLSGLQVTLEESWVQSGFSESPRSKSCQLCRPGLAAWSDVKGRIFCLQDLRPSNLIWLLGLYLGWEGLGEHFGLWHSGLSFISLSGLGSDSMTSSMLTSGKLFSVD